MATETHTPAGIAAELVDDGDTYEMDDGRVLRLSVQPDELPVLEYLGDGFGTLAWADVDRHNYHAQDAYRRPEGMDGGAEILRVGRGWDPLWWQPPSDGPARGTDDFARMRRHLLGLLEEGFYGVTVELEHQCPGCGTRHTETSASLWGVDLYWGTMDEREAQDEYLREIVGELVAEVLT